VNAFAGALLGVFAGMGLLLLASKMGWLSSLWELCSSGGSLLSCCGSSAGRASGSAAADTKQGGRYSSKGGIRYRMDSEHEMFEYDDDHEGRGKAQRHSSNKYDGPPFGRSSRSSSMPFDGDSYDGGGRGTHTTAAYGKGSSNYSSRRSYGQHDRGSISGFATANPLWEFDPRKAADDEFDNGSSSRNGWHDASAVVTSASRGSAGKPRRMSSRESTAGMSRTKLMANNS
jgi:hypothetical protein